MRTYTCTCNNHKLCLQVTTEEKEWILRAVHELDFTPSRSNGSLVMISFCTNQMMIKTPPKFNYCTVLD